MYDAAHLAQLIAALGPPPPDFLARNKERKADFWDDQGMSTCPRLANSTNHCCHRKLARSSSHTTRPDIGSS